MTGNMSEIAGFIDAGEVHALAVFAVERLPGFEQIPTTVEQGLDVVAVNWPGLYVPKDISDDPFNYWAGKPTA